MWMGEHITQKGIGNGISIILFAGIVSRGPSLMRTLVNLFQTGTSGIVSGIDDHYRYLHRSVHRIHVQCRAPHPGSVRKARCRPQDVRWSVHPSADQGQRVRRYADHLRILHPVPAADRFDVLAAGGSVGAHILNLFSQTSVFYIVLYALLILAFAYFYASIQFNPIEIANNLKKNGGFIPGFRPGKPTSDFITKALGKVTFVGAVFLGCRRSGPADRRCVISRT